MDEEGSSSLLHRAHPDEGQSGLLAAEVGGGDAWILDDGDQDAEEMRPGRSRSRSFYTVEPPDAEPEPPRTRSRSRSFQRNRVTPADQESKQNSKRTLKDREKQALEDGLADAAKQAELRGWGTPGRERTADSDSDFETTGEPIRRPSPGKVRKIKILMLGDVGVGKTSLMTRWTENQFHSAMISTAGVDFTTKELSIRGGRVLVQIWDTAGQERFHVITHSYYRGCNGIVLAFDATSSDEFPLQRLMYWLDSIKAHASKDVQVAVLCNKSDLVGEKERQVSAAVQAGQAMAKAQGYPFFFTSAKTSEGVEAAYGFLVQRVIEGQGNAPGSRSQDSDSAVPSQRLQVKGCMPVCSIS